MSWSGAAECTGLGVGYEVFDAVYVPAEGELPEVRYGRNYADKSRWTGGVPQHLGGLTELRDQWAAMCVTVRLFKVGSQGQELGNDAVVKVLQQVLQPIGEALGNLAVDPESEIMFDNKGVQANEDEEVLGYGGGFYVPNKMKDLEIGITEEQKAEMLKLWGRVVWSQWGQRSWGQAMASSCGIAQQSTSLLGCRC